VTSPATTILLGRKNYQGFGGWWPPVADDENADPRDRAFSRWLTATEKIVFSTTLTELPWANSRLATAGPAATVRELRETDGGDIVVLASSSVLRALLEAGELDRLSVTLCPEIAGGGPRLLDDGLPGSSWRLDSCAPTESGAVCLVYARKP
jgi:dihydrofolate reductase